MSSITICSGVGSKVIEQTFSSRRTAIPEVIPLALSETFVRGVCTARWGAFLNRTKLEAPPFPDVTDLLARIIAPPAEAARHGRYLSARWHPHTGWTQNQ
jgi:hypothetical protein